ncbi:MAG: hypothetical protein Q8P70_02315 [bacterium]|nr:hypothetical protein [bacterium]
MKLGKKGDEQMSMRVIDMTREQILETVYNALWCEVKKHKDAIRSLGGPPSTVELDGGLLLKVSPSPEDCHRDNLMRLREVLHEIDALQKKPCKIIVATIRWQDSDNDLCPSNIIVFPASIPTIPMGDGDLVLSKETTIGEILQRAIQKKGEAITEDVGFDILTLTTIGIA